ncbi:F-box/FBD/LRR-repeat protein At1g13570-like isoform X1 [Durio zibethinus]|uniref:F-box/FBD/LRR-repeat protein At1g13570-like isoform X1 n=1 Tax=Durio zibethinus TaxID=66656 RepID=A0A6P6B415_DURZI|nr:F-box/FBD/LRR-repeat protein At1g13570-like isoform X1 [Durio zibethinus]XP_022771903.1 F-box/FBD/LRR-repeat protein At1g13570-like isoform X1 [Durio zibethinus]XP_022771904.1 F-box/FBD/LRR-repeat protein At1g13570-like isoform X1 [Durio zibethinus]
MEKPVESDRISNLPWDVLNSILMHLPLRDAARTSLLSRTWKYKWTNLSQFVIDDKCFPNSLPDKARWGEVRRIFNHVRSNHSGPIEKFKLAAYCYPDHSDLDEWIIFLTFNGIKELILQDFSVIRRFKLPPCLFSCPQLICLELHGCIFKLPTTFGGFNCLKSLTLTQVSIISETLERLIHSCPILERLTLLNIDHLAILRIHNQNLKYLKVDSEFEDISLESCPLLASVDIHMIPMDGRTVPRKLEKGNPSNLIRVLGCLHGIKKLSLSSDFIKFLANGSLPERFPTPLLNLLFLDLKKITFSSFKDVAAFFSILRSSPKLEELVISVVYSNQACRRVLGFLKEQSRYDFFFSQLKVVRIRGLHGTKPEWEFLKLILAHSPVLETLTIVKYETGRLRESLLLDVERASENLKIMSLTL